MTYTPLRLLLLTLALAGCAGNQTLRNPKPVEQGTEASSDWAAVDYAPGFVLVNNVWNKGGAQGPYKQTIFKTDDGAFGWSWDWPKSTAPVVSYPEIIWGDKPWDPARAPVPGLPFHPGEKRMIVDFDITLEATGVYDMAFEFWPVKAIPGNEKNIASEVMVWLTWKGLPPAGQLEGSLDVGGNTFEVYVLRGHGDDSGGSSAKWSYVAIVPKKMPLLKGPIDFGVFVDYLLEKGILQKSEWITGLELGNEVQTGTGKATVRNFKISLK